MFISVLVVYTVDPIKLYITRRVELFRTADALP